MAFQLLKLVLTVLQFQLILTDHCIKRYFDQNSFVCACDTRSCPSIPGTTRPPKGYIDQWISSSQHRFNFTQIDLARLTKPLNPPTLVITLKLNDRRQTIHGFGGAFTDATRLNLLTLPMALQDQIMRDYFSTDGIDYSIGRVPIAGTDFSDRAYTYDDNNDEEDLELKHFALQHEDTNLKIPMIKRALELKNGTFRLICSSWSSPGWMKTNGKLVGAGYLRGLPGGRYYKTWAKYLIKFLDSYAEEGINFWAMTTQNEPDIAFEVSDFSFQTLLFTPENMRDWVKYDLGPELEKSGYGKDKLNLLLLDDNRQLLVNWTQVILTDETAASFINGIAFHWYKINNEPHYDELNVVHNNFPNHFLIATEACEGYQSSSAIKAQLGNWTRAETYAKDILEDLNRYTTGWVDWNLVLDTKGGPSTDGNSADALILVDTDKNEYYRNPMFYSFGHFSKFIPPDSVYIGHQVQDNPVDLVINKFATVPVSITLDGHSIQTLITPSSNVN
ncbi:glucosylceramidase-like isoform X2 [Tetranychus urticae]|uniref:glucosylceramidase-like isoform X2 n=1 Tax=Tetranychus urticae TaxID=32264 RepID=UPI000D6425C1|nr:glucosylceramidase-like isoform X2 [Tetranychus urticae]